MIQFILQQTVIADGVWSWKVRLRSVQAALLLIRLQHRNKKRSNSLYHAKWPLRATQSPTVPDLHGALSHLSFSREKWSLTQTVLALNPPGAVLKRHRSNVDRNTFIGIVSPFKRRLGVALAAMGRLDWLAGHLISLSPAPGSHAPGWHFRRGLWSWMENRLVLNFIILNLWAGRWVVFFFSFG